MREGVLEVEAEQPTNKATQDKFEEILNKLKSSK